MSSRHACSNHLLLLRWHAVQGGQLRQQDGQGGVSLVLGAGNQASREGGRGRLLLHGL